MKILKERLLVFQKFLMWSFKILLILIDLIWQEYALYISGCGIFGMSDIWDIECWGCGMFGMWDVRNVECLGCEMLEFLGYGMFRMWCVRDLGCSGCVMFVIWHVLDVRCLGCGMWDVCWDVWCWFTKCLPECHASKFWSLYTH